MTDTIKHVAICIPTFRRPGPLGHCLHSIGQLQLPEDVQVSVIVADNDVQKSAQAVFQQTAAGLPVAACYDVAPERGLSAVRNHLLEKALAHQATHIAFIDDDELVHPLWLIKMIEGLHRYQTDIISGPVINIRESTPPPATFTGEIKISARQHSQADSHQ